MKKKILSGILCLALILSIPVSLSGCAAKAADLTADVKANTVSSDIELTGKNSEAIADFAVKLIQNNNESDENTLLSPLSVLCALAMMANGAQGETLAQMEASFGLPVEELNEYLHAYIKSLPSDNKYKVSLADSIWFKDDENLRIEQDFLQINADYYSASIYKAAFDNTTLKDINDWVSDNTDGMIRDILTEIPDDAVMYLINALAFDAEWETVYKENQIREGTFTAQSGVMRDVEMMYGGEQTYLDDGNATGFVKYYSGRKYAFVALLPNEGLSVSDYISTLSGDSLMSTLENAQSVRVQTAIPKFENEYSVEMSDILKAMGMTDAFDGDVADFTGLGTQKDANIFISRVIHKTYIAVDEKGTKAGAATVVEAAGTSAAPEQPKTVYLDRPFVYMLIDCTANLPIFIGTVTDTGK